MFKSGDLVRHRSKPEWGLGRITGQTGEGKVLIKFTSRTGDVLLSADGAAAHLMSNTAPAGTTVMPATRRVQPPVRRTPCNTCSTDVREVVSSPDGAWRSCVECSARNGRQHVFLPYPASFDAAEVAPPEGETSDDPHYGWCKACRTGGRATGYKNCSDVMR
jgi:hypothetical protein